MEALEALSLATVNVAGFAVMMGAGAGWAFDVSGWEEVRGRLRERRRGRGRAEDGRDGDGGKGREEEEELEEWVRGMLGRKEGGERARGKVDPVEVEGEGDKGVERRRRRQER